MNTTGELNPLNEFETHTAYHKLIAFQLSNDAYEYDFNEKLGDVGTFVKGKCGTGIILVNEPSDSVISVNSAMTEWTFMSPVNFRSSSYIGCMEIVDRSGFYFTELLKSYTEQLKMSLHHLTFAWVVEFVGTKQNKQESELLHTTPMFFNVTNFIQNVSAIDGRTYYFDFVSMYNTHGISTQFSSMLQTTINHMDGNTINSMPTPVQPSTGLKSTKDEDSIKLSARKTRLEKMKYMKTIGEICKSFEVVLNNQTSDHKKQLQNLLTTIRNDYVEKVTKVNKTEPLPIVYKIKVDEYYSPIPLDNRNLPFEQYEINESIDGISSVTLPMGTTLYGAINHIMKMSKKVGRDHIKRPATTFKVTISTNRECDEKYHVYLKINKYISPYNSFGGIDTGPGLGLVGEPLSFTYQDNDAKDTNVNSITYGAKPHFNLEPIENISDAEDTQAVYGDREIITDNRKIDGLGYFEYSFSGLKGARGLYADNGLQNSEAASAITTFNPSQQTQYSLNILGNPDLLSDLNRNPLDVIGDVSGSARIYKFVEYEPMYIKLKIYLNADRRDTINGKKPSGDSSVFYYDSHMHIYKITNVFSPGLFNQTLFCSRTNEKV